MFGNRSLAVAMLGLAGVLLSHEIAYRLAGVFGWSGETLVPHGHMELLWAIFGPLGALGIAYLAVRQARSLRLDAPLSVPVVSVALAVPFLGLEIVEHLQSGATVGQALTAAPTVIGLALAIPVAAFLARSVDAVREVIETVVDALSQSGRRFRGQPKLIPVLVPTREAPRVVRPRESFDRRGPPSRP